MASSEDVKDITERIASTKVDVQNELSFKGKGIKLNKKEDAKEIIDAIEQCKTMTALRLEGNTLGVEAAEAIGEALSKHPEFERAHWSDMFTGRMKTEIPPALKHLGAAMIKAGAQLVELDLSDNAFGPNGVTGIVDLLKSKTCYTLKELRLNNNGLGTTGGKMLAECLMECYKASSAAGTPLALRVFISGRGRLENEGSKALSEVFKLMGSLEEVAMPQNGINHEGIAALAEAFTFNPNLRILNLNDNTFTERGATAIAKALPKLQNLEVINFGDCLIRNNGAKAIGKALKGGHKKLKELHLSGNEIGRSGGIKIAEALEDKETIEMLDLDANQMGDTGRETVRAIFKDIGKLDKLGSLSGDEGSDEDDEDDDDEDEEAEEDAEDDTEGEVVNDPELQVKGTAISKEQTIEDFLSSPTTEKLHGLGKQLKTTVRQYIGTDISDPEKVVNTIVRMALVVTEDDQKIKKTVCECADGILTEVFTSQEDMTGSLIANAYLVYIGLLKGEDKKYKPPSDIRGPLLVLEHIVRQSYFPQPAKKILSAFMDKPHPLLSKITDVQSRLLQALFAS